MLNEWPLPLGFEFELFDCRTMGVVIGVLAVISLVADWNRVRFEGRRYRALRELAGREGWNFLGDQACPKPENPRFQWGVRQAPVNTMVASLRGREIQMGDFNYQRETSDRNGHRNTTNYYFSYCWARLPGAIPGELLIRPERPLDKLQAAAGFEDINFESDDFSRRNYVQSSNRRFAYDLIAPQMMEYLLAHPGYTIEVGTAGLILTLSGETRWKPERFAPAVDFAVGFLERIPAHVWAPPSASLQGNQSAGTGNPADGCAGAMEHIF